MVAPVGLQRIRITSRVRANLNGWLVADKVRVVQGCWNTPASTKSRDGTGRLPTLRKNDKCKRNARITMHSEITGRMNGVGIPLIRITHSPHRTTSDIGFPGAINCTSTPTNANCACDPAYHDRQLSASMQLNQLGSYCSGTANSAAPTGSL